MPHLTTATLVKRVTDNGLSEVNANVPLGRKYTIDLDTIQNVRAFNVDHNVFHDIQIVFVDNGRWFPLELLDVPALRS